MVFIRNVKFSVAECNSFNMRKKNIEDLASRKIIGESNAKKHPLGCKVTTIEVQSSPFKTVYLYSLSVYLCSFGCFYRLKLLKIGEYFKYIFTFCFLRFYVFQLPCGINQCQGHGTYIFNLLIFLIQIGHERYDDNNSFFEKMCSRFEGAMGFHCYR